MSTSGSREATPEAIMNMFTEICQAEKRIRPYVYETPLDESQLLSDQAGMHIFLKCEYLQKTGSFKFRGALNKMLSLSEEERSNGIIAASTGNHGQGVALAAKILGVQATIYVPSDASSTKVRVIETLGASVKLCQRDSLQTEILARQIAKKTNTPFISPYNDVTVIAGQGTIGAELFQQHKHLDAVFISVGGGGLISGIASYLQRSSPNIEIVGCWPRNAPTMHRCIKAGRIFDVPEKPTISDGTAGGIEPNSITFTMCKDLIHHHVLVSESEIVKAMRLMVGYERAIIEGAAGVALAGALKMASTFKGKNLAVVLCGRNISLEKFRSIMK